MIFQLCSKSVLMIIKYHISNVEVFWGSKETISGHFRPNGKSYFDKWKISKLAKKSILAKNSNFDRVADIGRNDDIWPEMGPWGVLESFCTSIRYFNAFRSIFMKFQKMPFLTCWNMIYGHFRVDRIFYGSKIGQQISAKAKTHLDPFPKNFPRTYKAYSLF